MGPALLGVGLAMPVTADEELVAWMDRAHDASHRVNYSGTLALIRGQQLRVLEVRQGFDGSRRMRYLRSISGPHIEFLRLGDVSHVVYPDHKLVIQGEGIEPVDLAPFEDHFKHAPEYYHLQNQGMEQVAGRNCQNLRFTPRDHYRYGCELCMDQSSGLLLQVRVLSSNGEMLEQFAFTSLKLHGTFSEFAPGSFKLQTDMRGFAHRHMPSGAQPTSAQWQVQKLPPGFAVRHTMAQHRGEDRHSVLHMVVSDALSRVSVFIEDMPPNLSPSQMPGHFMRHSYNGYMIAHGDHLVTVVGNAPFETVRMIANSLMHP